MRRLVGATHRGLVDGAWTTVGRILLLGAGTLLVFATLYSAVRSFVLPRASVDPIPHAVFVATRALFGLRTRQEATYEGKDRIMALYAPVSLLMLPIAWLALIGAGFIAIFEAVVQRGWYDAALRSGSLLTFGFVAPTGAVVAALVFAEAAVGLALLSLFLAYLPTMYTAFSRRELAVTMLEVRAGAPPSGVELLRRYESLGWRGRLPQLWEEWERWFVDVGETHTSLAALTHFRSPKAHRCWVTAAGAVLDAAALRLAAVDLPTDPFPTLCLDAGQRALTDVAQFFRLLERDWRDVTPGAADGTTGIHVRREEFERALDVLAEAGVPIRADRDGAWREFAALRSGYEGPLFGLCQLVMAPSAPWSSDRVERYAGR
jgi:hypothetical protein